MEMLKYMHKKKHYNQSLKYLNDKYSKRNTLYDYIFKRIRWKDLFFHQNKTAVAIRNLIKQKKYTVNRIKTFRITINGKEREIGIFNGFDIIVSKVISQYLETHLDHIFIDNLYSYRPGKNIQQAKHNICTYIKHNINNNKKQDLYVFQADISNYTNSISTHNNAPIWNILFNALNTINKTLDPYIKETLVNLTRPKSIDKRSGREYVSIKGLAMGTPTTNVIANLYLNEVDHSINNIDNSFYVRYGDDIIFMHPDKNKVIEVSRYIKNEFEKLGLKLNKDKEKFSNFNRAGRSEDKTFIGTSTINYIGYGFNANGHAGVKKGKVSKLKNMIRRRLIRVKNLTRGLSPEEKARIMSEHINNTMQSDSKEAEYYANQISKIDDKDRINQLNKIIENEIAECSVNHNSKQKIEHLKLNIIRPALIPVQDIEWSD